MQDLSILHEKNVSSIQVKSIKNLRVSQHVIKFHQRGETVFIERCAIVERLVDLPSIVSDLVACSACPDNGIGPLAEGKDRCSKTGQDLCTKAALDPVDWG